MMNLSKSRDYFSPAKASGSIHIVGCGSVGATLAENLARLGLTRFALWDFDAVEPHNLTNQIFRQQDLGRLKVEALRDILLEINPDIADSIKLYDKGWSGQQLSGYIFLCVDSIEVRRQIVEKHLENPFVSLVIDFRTALESAQHYAADWKDYKAKQTLLASMEFSHEEAAAEAPVSACGTTLGVAPTVRAICAVGVANFVNFINGKGLKKFVNFDVFNYLLDAF